MNKSNSARPPSAPIKPTKLTWHQRNSEKNREQCRRYAQSHRLQVTARVRRWQLKQDPAAFRALQRQYEANARARQLQAVPL
jgi:hypothetical protein